jgi:hypothetical protein
MKAGEGENLFDTPTKSCERFPVCEWKWRWKKNDGALSRSRRTVVK